MKDSSSRRMVAMFRGNPVEANSLRDWWLGNNLAKDWSKTYIDVVIILLQQRLSYKGFSQCTVRYMGGNHVQLSLLNANESWDTSFFAKIASSWGKFVHVDECTKGKKHFDITHVLIHTSTMGLILKSILTMVNNHMFSIKVVEGLAGGHVCLESIVQFKPGVFEGASDAIA
ncbi:hypothetical protein Ancab_016300 [Ancistrocladus abbreviatus]